MPARREGAVKLGLQHVRNGELSFRMKKTSAVVTRPILAPLAESTAATPWWDLADIGSEQSRAITKGSFGNGFS
nr:hypothetical protein NG677_01630 [Methylobacterium sp. OTU13CASTA1]